MKKINCNQKLEIEYQKKWKTYHYWDNLCCNSFIFKILLIPRIQNHENNKNNIKMIISYKQDKNRLSLKINIKTKKLPT